MQNRPGGALVDRGRLLGLPCASLGSVRDDTTVRAVALDGAAEPRQSLDGVLVVDLSSLWAGPLCTTLLGRAGAKVIKVETVGRPDGARRGNAAFYDFLHAGHESLLLDLADRDDRDRLARLIAAADIVVESSRPRALCRWGIDSHEVCEQGPTTWVSITAYGRRFPDRVGFGDDVAMASGQAARDVDDDWPLPTGDAIADPLTGMHAAVHALASYRVGGSRILDVAMSEVVASTVAWSLQPASPA